MMKKYTFDESEKINKEICNLSKKKDYANLMNYIAKKVNSQEGIAFIRYYNDFLVPYGSQAISVASKNLSLPKAIAIKNGLSPFKFTILHQNAIKEEHFLKF